MPDVIIADGVVQFNCHSSTLCKLQAIKKNKFFNTSYRLQLRSLVGAIFTQNVVCTYVHELTK
jgi:hypothetical protein